jgi:hypothetical protein
MKRYKITYPGGVSQEKNLVERSLYDEVIKPIDQTLYKVESMLAETNAKKKKELVEDLRHTRKKIKSVLSSFGEYFVSDSPLGQAMMNGGKLILPEHQGGITSPVIFEEIK